VPSSITTVRGPAIALRGDDIDTDRIMPARFLRSVSFDGLEDHLFEDDRKTDAAHPFNVPAFRGASVLIVNANFGCGSSREHAPQGLYRWGIRAAIGESFSDIFFGNSVAIGLPCVTTSPATVATLQAMSEADPQLEVIVDLQKRQVTAGGQTFEVSLPDAAQHGFISGAWDATGLLLDRYEEVDAVAARLPYLASFTSSRNTPAAFDSSPDRR
jgi:3-isopropylmalate/(R)-2-methylmalate dehydratase small subunit